MKDWLDKRLAAGGILGRDLKSALGRQLCGWGASPCQTRPWGLSSPGQRCSQGACLPGSRMCTSSTAQGGGRSFKKRKTIGEIGCCESRMSKQKH